MFLDHNGTKELWNPSEKNINKLIKKLDDFEN